MSDPRRLEVDVGRLDLEKARTEALRLVAAPEGGVDVHLAEAARKMTELFDELELDAVDDEDLASLAHRILEVIAGLTIVGSRAVDAAADSLKVDRLDVLHQIDESVREDTEGP